MLFPDMTTFQNFQYYKFHLSSFSSTSQQGRVSSSRRDRSHSPRVRDFVLPGRRRCLLSCWMCLDSGTENWTEQKRVRSNVVGHGGRGERGSLEKCSEEESSEYARRALPRGWRRDRVQIPITPCPLGIRRLSGEPGWRQLQGDADRKTPCAVTVAPEMLLDETDGRHWSPHPFADEQTPDTISPYRRHVILSVLGMSLYSRRQNGELSRIDLCVAGNKLISTLGRRPGDAGIRRVNYVTIYIFLIWDDCRIAGCRTVRSDI